MKEEREWNERGSPRNSIVQLQPLYLYNKIINEDLDSTSCWFARHIAPSCCSTSHSLKTMTISCQSNRIFASNLGSIHIISHALLEDAVNHLCYCTWGLSCKDYFLWIRWYDKRSRGVCTKYGNLSDFHAGDISSIFLALIVSYFSFGEMEKAYTPRWFTRLENRKQQSWRASSSTLGRH